MPRKLVLNLGFTLLFWAIFDGLLSFFIPIYVVGLGFTKTELGLIIAFQSITGAVFDFLISKYLKKYHYLTIFFIFFFLSLIFPLILWYSKTTLLLLFAMTVWGLYYDLLAFAVFDFSSRHSLKNEHCQNIGAIGVFKSAGYLIAPLIGSLLVINSVVSFGNILYSYIFLFISGILFIVFYANSADHRTITFPRKYHHQNAVSEITLWFQVGRILIPVLLFNLLLSSFDYIFWTLGPLLPNGGYFMFAYVLPVIIIGWSSEIITRKLGKKVTAYASFLLGSLVLTLFFWVNDPYLILLVIFFASLFSSLAWPSLKGAYVDYLVESPAFKQEIEGL
ncbi:MAG: MFS transporter, partial [Candidatus Shapirobacteria bacterium]|nr:MFS transporter [Candidatus Shapirobacteria bacterium]